MKTKKSEMEEKIEMNENCEFEDDFDTITQKNVKKALETTESDPEIREYIEEKLKNHKVVIFSRTYCSYSKLVKHIFHEVDHIYHAVELDKLNCGYEMFLELVRMTDNDHLPHVYVKGKYIGGGINLEPLNNIGKIRELLDLPPPPMFVPTKTPWAEQFQNPAGIAPNQVPFGHHPAFIRNEG